MFIFILIVCGIALLKLGFLYGWYWSVGLVVFLIVMLLLSYDEDCDNSSDDKLWERYRNWYGDE